MPYFYIAKFILSYSFDASVYSLNEMHRYLSLAILPNIFGEDFNSIDTLYAVWILCSGVCYGMKSETAAQSIMILFSGRISFNRYNEFKYMYIDLKGRSNSLSL